MSTIVTLYSIEEHVGKTTFGINFGASLIRETRRSVIVVDLSTAGNGLSAGALLKLFPLHPLQTSEFNLEDLNGHVQWHSSQLAILTIDPTVIHDETLARSFITRLFDQLQSRFDYILIDAALQANRFTYEAIDFSEVVIFFSTAIEHEYPVEILGKQNLRHVVNMHEEGSSQVTLQKQGCYALPKDVLAFGTFRKSGIPFVIQFPYRPISQMIARLARDLGHKRLGLALIGGAAFGLSQLGILDVFERNRIAIDVITGTGFGAFIGAAYALGVNRHRLTSSIVNWALSQTYLSRMHSFIFRGRLLKEKTLQALFDTFLHDVYFEELMLPFHVTAFNARTGKGVIFRTGKVLDAIKLSMRISGLFVPFKQTEKYLVDSSMVLPTLVQPLEQMGAHILTAVHIPLVAEKSKRRGTHVVAQERRRSKSQFLKKHAIMAATFDTLMEQLAETSDDDESSVSQQIKPDVLIVPNIKDISWRDFHRVHDLIEAGIQAAEQLVPQLENLTIND